MQRRIGQGRAPAITAAIVTGTLIGTGISAIAAVPAYADVPVAEAYVSDLPWLNESNGWGPIERDTSNGESAAGDGRPITIGGTVYEKGIGMHATGALSVELGANCTAFRAFVGLDDEVTSGVGTTRFQVYGDGQLLAETGVLTGTDAPFELAADVTDVEELRLVADEATNGKNFDHADWGDAKLICDDEAPAEPTIVERWAIDGPAGSALDGELMLDSRGRLALDVRQGDDVVVSAQRLGLVGSDGDFRSQLSFVDRLDREVADQYTMTSGKEKDREYVHAESVFTFENAAGVRFSIDVRLAGDGAAYRYLVEGDGEHRVDDESGSWLIPSDGAAWMQRSYAVNYEAEWMTTTATAANGTGSVGYPALFEQGEQYVLLTESDVHGDYSGSHLSHGTGSLRYGVDLFEGKPVTSTGDLSTPWRVAIVGGLDDVVESTLVDDLATPNQLDGEDDTSWIRAGVSSWSWLTDWNSPKDEARQRDFVDLSAAMGWEYVLLDEGWDASWVPRTVRYAHSKGVDVIIWFHSRDLRTQAQRDEWLPKIASWGVSGIKVDFMDSDSQAIHQWYDQIAADTAKHHLMLNFHGASLPTGMQRTWPHIMAYEAVRGAENGISPQRSLTVPFTRNVVGSMDWTPVTFSRGNGNSSKAHEVAMAIVYESGWQHMSDKPESYAAEPNAVPFLQNIPAEWKKTELLSGRPGSNVVLARQSGDRWFVGGMRAGSGDPLQLPLGDLTGLGKNVLVDLLTDDGANGSSTVASTISTTTDDTIEVPTATNGGFAAVVCAAKPGRETCLEPVEPAPAAALDVEPADRQAQPGSTFELTASFSVSDRDVRQVVVTPTVPEGWTLEGAPVTAKTMASGHVLEASWTVTVPADGASGTVEVPVTAEYRDGGRPFAAYNQATVWVTPPPLHGTVYVSDLEWAQQSNGYGPIERDQSNGQAGAGDGRPIEIDDVVYEKGVGMHATGSLTTWLGGTCSAFDAIVGIDDEVLETPGESGIGSVRFRVFGDGVLLTETAVLTNDDAAMPLSVDVTGVQRLQLVADEATNGKNFDHADWADAKLTCDAG